MKILLLNDNPVVTKLVTLSAHKTSDELDVVNSLDEIDSKDYDLLVVDDTLYSDETLTELKDKINFSMSLYICSRDAAEVKGFTKILKKPFLPTDLVEIFSVFGKEANNIDLSEALEEAKEEITPLDAVDEIEELSFDDEISLDDGLSLDDDLSLDDEDISLDDELSLDDEFSLDDDEDEDELGESVLDDEEAQKVKDLLDETEEDILDDLDEDLDLNLDDDLDTLLEDLDSEELTEIETKKAEPEELEDELEDLGEELGELDDLEEEVKEDSEQEDLDELEDELDNLHDFEDELEEEVQKEDELEEQISELDEEMEIPEDLDLNEDIESQIQSAVEELSEEDLASEVDEDTLLEIATNEIDSLDGLTSRDLKLAIGEEVEEEISDMDDLDESIDELVVDEETQEDELIEEEANDGVESLKKLLAALSDKNVAASMKGMKISINITLGDN
jgi:uncharacterized membrane protein